MTDRLLRQFAGMWILVFGGFAALEAFSRHRSGRAIVLGLIAAAIGGTGLLKPPVIRPVFVTAMALTAPIGWVFSRLLLALIFFVVMVPIAWVLRLRRRDSLSRRFNPNADSYWKAREQPSDPLSYLHQS